MTPLLPPDDVLDLERFRWLCDHVGYVMAVDRHHRLYQMAPPDGNGDLRASIDAARERDK